MSKALGIALLGGVSAWTAHLLLSYLLADLACRGDTALLLAGRHALTLVAGASVVVVTLAVRPLFMERTASGVRGPARVERPFLARLALTLNVLFLLAILMAGSTSLFLVSCV